MGGFQKTVLIIALVILLLILLIIGIVLRAAKSNAVWPPVVPDCPDWWVSDGSGNNSKCLNVKNLGTCNVESKSFSGPIFSGSNGACAKHTWAKKCKVAWDGISYGVSNPCSS